VRRPAEPGLTPGSHLPPGPERWPGCPATGLGQKPGPAGSAIWPGHPVDGDSWSARGLPRRHVPSFPAERAPSRPTRPVWPAVTGQDQAYRPERIFRLGQSHPNSMTGCRPITGRIHSFSSAWHGVTPRCREVKRRLAVGQRCGQLRRPGLVLIRCGASYLLQPG